ncbi:MAG TPA: FAD-dependent oxidoreductase [Chloroflexota bacterium]|jgi:phytoene dehydrogenase-like protein
MMDTPTTDAIVVGGGLAGLAAATYLARGGRRVTLFEQAAELGGRARTVRQHEFLFNEGPHAVYLAGVGAQVYRELGVAYHGGSPGSGAYVVRDGRLHAFPLGPRAFLSSDLLSAGEKLAVLPLVARLIRTDPAPLVRLPLRQWLDRSIPQRRLRQLVEMLIRVSTFSNDPDRQSAGAALAQLQLALKGNVLYLDGGWQTLVDGLRRAAEAAGVCILSHARVAAVLRDAAVRGVRLADGTSWEAPAVVVAASPAAASALVADGPPTVLRRWAEATTPVLAATLDVALRRLPEPRHLTAYGTEEPLYLSVHSAVARLAPAGGATIHLLRYLGADQDLDAQLVERQLDGLLDLMQPGWRAEAVARRFLPRMVVANALVTAAQGGTAGRPGPAVPDVPGLYVAGDWVGPDGMLSDAGLASARQAARLVLGAEQARPVVVPREPLALGA